MRTRRVLLALLAGAVIGFTIFGLLAYRAVSVEEATVPEALRRFESIRGALGGAPPLIALDDAGNVVRRTAQASPSSRPVSRLGVLAYQADEQRLVTADVPMWFFKLKGPAAQYFVRGTGLDLERLQITASDLERHGPSVVIDQVRTTGDRLLVWTE